MYKLNTINFILHNNNKYNNTFITTDLYPYLNMGKILKYTLNFLNTI